MIKQPPDYDIFNDIETLKTSLYVVENENGYTKNTDLCENININPGVGNNPKDICKNFVKLFNVLLVHCGNNIETLKNKKYPDFMNYWLNQKLRDVVYDDNTKDNFFKEVKHITDTFEAKDVLKNMIYVMDTKYLINLHILYKLYENYEKLNKNELRDYNEFLTEMKCHYNNGLEKCFFSGDVKFCKALKNFRDYYEKDKNTNSTYCKGKDHGCRSLPELNILSTVSRKEELNIAKLGKELIGTSYAPTLNEYSLYKSEEYYNLKDLIFVQYNLRMEKDEDDKKYAMMKILDQFIQYCNNKKDELKLSLFMNEFIEEYYNKNKSEYKNMFEECKPKTKSDKHCNVYRTCNEKHKRVFTLVTESPAKYIEEQETHIKAIYPIGFLLLKAQTMIQDSRAMSKYSTTIISIMISIFLCFFFLYKFNPFGNILHRGKKKKKKIPLFFPEPKIQDVNDYNTGPKNVKTKRGKIRFSYQPA